MGQTFDNTNWQNNYKEKGLKLYQANVTCWGDMAQSYFYQNREEEILFISEHRWKDDQELKRKLGYAGYKAAIEPATEGRQGGASGGVLVAWKR